MISFTKSVPTICVSLFLLLSNGSVLAQYQDNEPGESSQSQGRFYGKGHPKTTRDLPPGQLRKSLDNLQPYAKSKALRWLQEFSFPAADVESLRVTADGSIHYADSFLPTLAATDNAENLSTNPAMSATEVFQLHSKPGSSQVVYLDFDGHTMEGTAWNVNREPVLVALPFDPSQNDSPPTVANFTQDELNRIAEIWHRMSEDFAAFDIDVTTEEPDVFTPTTGRVLFTLDTDAYGASMPSRGAGGVAWVNPWGRSNYATYYSPALVYYKNLQGSATYNAEAGSHELGHNLGLSHDGTQSGSKYYAGHGNGLVDWAPIMGNSYSRNVTQWSAGDYPDANNTQDDLAIIAEELGYVADDHSDSADAATPIKVEANGDILVSSPEQDPNNLLTENKGVINDRSDVDWFYFDLPTEGAVNITATPAWHSFERNDYRGANLDIELTLYDSSLVFLDISDPNTNSKAAITASLPAGRYFIQVDGVGNFTNSDYSDYSSLGMYFLEGSVQAGEISNTAPSPAIMSWQAAPHATGNSTFSMTAVEAIDDSGVVEYNFSCVVGGNGCTSSGWQSSRTWSPDGLDANTYYSYKVTARNMFGLTNTASPTMGDTTDASTPPAENEPPSASASYSPAPAVISKGKTVEVSFDGSNSEDPDGNVVSWVWKDNDGSTVSTSKVFSRKLGEGTHDFTLTVTDNTGASSNTSLSVSVTKGGDAGGGGGKKCNPRKQVCS